MNRASLLFCAAALAASLALCAAAFPFAALPEEVLRTQRQPVPAERLPDIDVGGGFGKVSVLDLVGYYLDNPPAPAGSDVAVPAVKRFRGC